MELARLGLLAVHPRSTASGEDIANALLEAFGDDGWSTRDEAAVLAELAAAPAPQGRRGERRPRYAAMVTGETLECVMALGFDDRADGADGQRRPTGAPTAGERVRELSHQLRSRGYVEGSAPAAALLMKIGRPCTSDAATTYFSRAGALRLTPIAGRPSTRDVVVRLVANADGGSGDAAAAAFADGLAHAALCLYVGHWRYGLGPDFEPGLAVDVTPGTGLPTDPRTLALIARSEARRRAESIETVLDRWHAEGRIAVTRSAASRVTLGRQNVAPRNATARVVHWLARDPGAPSPPFGAITEAATSPRHRLWMLNSCRSALAFHAIRRTLDASSVRLVGLRGLSSMSSWSALPWVLDAVRAGGPWSELLGAIARPDGPGPVVVDGWEEDPRIP